MSNGKTKGRDGWRHMVGRRMGMGGVISWEGDGWRQMVGRRMSSVVPYSFDWVIVLCLDIIIFMYCL